MLIPIDEADVPAVVVMMEPGVPRGGPAAGWSTEAGYIAGDRTTEALLRAELAAAPDALLLKWIAPIGGDLVGCVWLEPRGRGVWYLGSLATDRGW